MKYIALIVLVGGLSLAGMAGVTAAADGQAVYARCARCHGVSGDKPPHILKGQERAELLRKLRGYAGGAYGGENRAIMHKMAGSLTPEEMEAVLGHIETF